MVPLLVVATLAALAAVLRGEARNDARAVRVAKPVASAGFLALAVAAGALDTPYGQRILGALVLCWVGDVALLSRGRRAFLIGLCAFALGHLGFVAAFVERGLAVGWLVPAALGLTIPALSVHRWITPYVPSRLRRPVEVYIVIISAMVATAVATVAAQGSALILAGAVAFFLSDLSVAQDRFVQSSLGNRLWGLPMYYVAQILLALSV